MQQDCRYLQACGGETAQAIVQDIDRDVERGEDVLMLGLGIVMLSSTFAPVAPPVVLLPLVALTLALSVLVAHWYYRRMERKLFASLASLSRQDRAVLRPIVSVFAERPAATLADAFNPFKNGRRTLKSALGGVLINPLWMPIFYMIGLHSDAEKLFALLNRKVIDVERGFAPPAARG